MVISDSITDNADAALLVASALVFVQKYIIFICQYRERKCVIYSRETQMKEENNWSQIKGYDTIARLSDNTTLFNAILSDPWHNGEPFFIARYDDFIPKNETRWLQTETWT